MRLVATPAQHFSGRGLSDGNSTLWASWVILAGDLRVFFSGDTGYHADFKTIGERFGPFDVTFMETGAYDAQWPDVHMQPEQTLQAHLDLRGRWLMPLHNGTFDLAMHAWHEPFDRILALAQARGVALATPGMGERLSLAQPQAGERWWQDVETAARATPAAQRRPEKAPAMTISAIITGASGMVGEGVLLECLADPRVGRVLVITRKPSRRHASEAGRGDPRRLRRPRRRSSRSSPATTPASSAWACRRSA